MVVYSCGKTQKDLNRQTDRHDDRMTTIATIDKIELLLSQIDLTRKIIMIDYSSPASMNSFQTDQMSLFHLQVGRLLCVNSASKNN